MKTLTSVVPLKHAVIPLAWVTSTSDLADIDLVFLCSDFSKSCRMPSVSGDIRPEGARRKVL